MYAINPPLLNSASRWATSTEELDALYRCPSTGAITIRTSQIKGFDHDDRIHKHCFFDGKSLRQIDTQGPVNDSKSTGNAQGLSSLNTLGYSPVSLHEYIGMIRNIEEKVNISPPKPVIFSVTTGTQTELRDCFELIKANRDPDSHWMIEVNLSCPNIPKQTPPAYSHEKLRECIDAISACFPKEHSIPFGLKIPPYTYAAQFQTLIDAIDHSKCPISFITATNTLGSCFMPGDDLAVPAIGSAATLGLGAMAGTSLHPLALGNVRMLRHMLDAKKELKHIQILGVGGVMDHAGYARMRAVGAAAVGVATALGACGVGVFEDILKDDSESHAS